VPVASETDIVEVSNSDARISLLNSSMGKVEGTATLNPASAGTDVTVAAKQTYGMTTTVTVKSVIADESAGGAYELILPFAATQLGAYSMTPPIVFADQANPGLYSLEASATGYAAPPSTVTISATPQTRNFVLVP